MAGVASARIANRHALHSVYYSTAKKTALPLNETCTRASSDTRRRIRVTTVVIVRAYARRATKFVYASSQLQKIRLNKDFCNGGNRLSTKFRKTSCAY